ncbi:MAG TPA: hypothetical protein V6D29_25310 [Leptolyngbyaceae cyanobacterium]
MNIALNPAIQEALSHVSNQETVKHFIIGDFGAVNRAQEILAILGYAEKIFWTKPQPIGLTGEYISVLTKRNASNAPINPQ